MYKSIFISAALALLQAHVASAKRCDVGIYNSDGTGLKAYKNIDIPASYSHWDFDFKYGSATYKVRLHYDGCRSEIIGEPKLPSGLMIRGSSPQ